MQCYTSTTVVEREAERGRGRHRRDDSATSWISRMQLVFGADNVTLFVPCRRAMCRSYQQFSCTSPTCRYQHTGRRRQSAQFGKISGEMGWQPSPMVKTLLGTLSVLYCLLLLAIYIAPLATGLIAPEPSLKSYGYKPELVLNGIHIYMFATSVLFLFYLIFGLSRASSSTSYQGSHASAFVRVGAVFFGLGTIGHLALRLMEDAKSLLDEDNDCSKTPEMLARLLCLLSVVLQISAIILCSRLKLKPGWGAPYFGLMHMVATNMVAWAWAVYEESLHITHEAISSFEGGQCIVGRSYDVGHHRNKRASDSSSNCQPLSKASEPFFYPFLIEFVLIGEYVCWFSLYSKFSPQELQHF